ncbi:MAG: ferritin [Gemmatimonadota bacterium]
MAPMNEKVLDGLNRQINREFFAAYLYLALSAEFDRRSLDGFAVWMRAQAREEMDHAMRLVDHLQERGAKVTLDAIEKPDADFESVLEAFEAALEHESRVTEWIHELYDLAVEHHDHPEQLVLEWFVTEQVEEEDSIGTIVDQLRMAGDNQAAILMLDRELGARGAGGEG